MPNHLYGIVVLTDTVRAIASPLSLHKIRSFSSSLSNSEIRSSIHTDFIMSRQLNINILETEQDLIALLHQQTQSNIREKIIALYLLKIGKVKTLKDLAKTIGRNTTTLSRWFQTYKTQGLDSLLQK